ncbi:hypothetical protein NDU88_004419 [Pleurodeles waltl]|uniref:Uncharacterized protein n=1 Tax=Pleurodeles waltl TaxID=8319 RepID=A0AAV7T8B3_PLEWA|nr:hypothetical protein NDU88_004419 [Pleurodeles waltl]
MSAGPLRPSDAPWLLTAPLRPASTRFYNMASFDDNRDTLAAELFSRKPLAARTTDSTTAKEGLRQKFIKLERLRKQELARWWDITTLKRYLELKQVPRGLRVIIFPSFEDLDPDLLGEWEHLISSTSFSMINILIKHADRKRTKLLQDIASLEEEIKNLNLPEATDKNHTIMREILTGYQLYIKDKKMRKLVRDDNDYSNVLPCFTFDGSHDCLPHMYIFEERHIRLQFINIHRINFLVCPFSFCVSSVFYISEKVLMMTDAAMRDLNAHFDPQRNPDFERFKLRQVSRETVNPSTSFTLTFGNKQAHAPKMFNRKRYARKLYRGAGTKN